MVDNTLDRSALQSALDRLAGAGLNLAAVFDVQQLPDDVQSTLGAEAIDLERYACLVLLGHGGRQFWDALQARGMVGADPIDRYSTELACEFAHQTLRDPDWRLLYPGPTRLSLQSLGMAAGWAYESPVGLGIHPIYGLWWAYRVALLTTRQLSPLVHEPAISPCAGCVEKPCLSACPASALKRERAMDIEACSGYRLSYASSCRSRCLARLACPAGAQHRYDEQQLHYHYDHSFQTIRRFFASSG